MRGWNQAFIAAVAALGLASVAEAAPKPGQPAPDFSVTTFGGQTVSLADLRGNVIILNFWATWCAPCLKELSLLEGLFRSYHKYGFQVLAVATEDSVPDRALRPLAAQLTIPFVKRMKGPYRVLKGVPTNYIIDRSGTIAYAQAGAIDLDTFNEVVLPLLREPVPPAVAATPPSVAHP